MNEKSVAQMRAERNYQALQYLRQSVGGSEFGAPVANFEACGPPTWDRGAWQAFHAQYGRYPFGPQPDGGVIRPSTMVNAPDWVYELMGERKPPVTVMPQ